uniref:Uncharacterized protein n=1 Tax=Rhizophora mucronata TaxID=61149 RepID=A0A2P2QGK5_RHIMU
MQNSRNDFVSTTHSDPMNNLKEEGKALFSLAENTPDFFE